MARALVLGMLIAAAAPAQGGSPTLRPGSWEVGLSGSFRSVSGTHSGSLALRGTRFVAVGPGRGSGGVEVAYTSVAGLDVLDAEGTLGWGRQAGESAAHPYLELAAGIRQEWVGSFRQARVPVGVNVGVRSLVSSAVAVRMDYRFRRMLNDPVSDFSEHRASVGVSLLLNNETP